MNIFNRAMVTVVRQSGKSVILFLIIFILGIVLSGVISIRNAMVVTEESLMMRMPAIGTIGFDFESAVADPDVSPQELGRAYQIANQPTAAELSSVGHLPYVRAYDFFLQSMFFSRDLFWTKIEMDEDRLPAGADVNSLRGNVQGARAMGGQIEMFPGRGVSNPNITDIDAGLITLVAGRTFTQEEINQDAKVVVISQAFAHENDLTIGSMIELENIAHDYTTMGLEGSGNFVLDRHEERFMLAHRRLSFEVIGIFDIAQAFIYEAYEGWLFSEALFRRTDLNNRFYVPFGVAEDMLIFEAHAMLEVEARLREAFGDGEAEDMLNDDPLLESIFVLYDPRDLEAFAMEANEFLPEFWEIRDLRAVDDHVIASMDTLLQIADVVQWSTMSAAIVILTLIMLLFLRERRHEIGIYLALGDQKRHVLTQFLTEIGLIVLMAIVLSLFAGHFLSETISSYMLEQHLRQSGQGSGEIVDELPWELALFNPGAMPIEEVIELYQVGLSVEVMLTFTLISGAIVVLSVVVPVIYVTRLEPKQILM